MEKRACALFLLSGFLFIDTKRFSNQPPAKTRTFLIVFQTKRAKNWQPQKINCIYIRAIHLEQPMSIYSDDHKIFITQSGY